MYGISEDIETVQVIVSTNREHILPVTFEIVFTNDSAIGKPSTNAMYCVCSMHILACVKWLMAISSENVAPHHLSGLSAY